MISALENPRLPWEEETFGLCPVCLRTVPTRLHEENGRIYLTQQCPRHGDARALIASNADEYRRLRTFVPDRAGGGCCGPGTTCDTDGPPVCALILEITQACNLRCPTCYADAGSARLSSEKPEHEFMSLDEARRRLDTFFRSQSRLDILMLSGGEPTIHPQFQEMLDLALEYPLDRVVINTNGIRLNKDAKLVQTLHDRRRRIELYFSFASFRPDTHVRLYGRDLVKEKLDALNVARDAGVFVTLVPTVEAGVNEDEIAALYRYALSMDNIVGLTYQPVMNNGRYLNSYEALDRLTLTGTLAALEAQTNGAIRISDFIGLPCSHPDCCAITYGVLDHDRTQLEPLPRHLDVTRYMELFSDRISFSGLVGAAARRVWGDTVNLRGGQTLRDLTLLFTRGGVRDLLPLRRDPDALARRLFRIVVKPFMDAHTYDERRVKDCCTKILNDKGEAVSFCEYNVFHRGRLSAARHGLALTMSR